MTLSDELIITDVGSFDWGQKDQKVFLNWSDATLGILSACSLLLVSRLDICVIILGCCFPGSFFSYFFCLQVW